MESNNSSSNTATACSSDPPPPNQRNDDKGKQTCSNESEANNNPDNSVLKPGNEGRSSQNEGRSSQYNGVTWRGRKTRGDGWIATMCKGTKSKPLYLGIFGTEEEAAEAYDIAAIRLKDLIPGERELNFDLKNYNTEEILKCSKIPIGEGACESIKELTAEEFLTKNNIEIIKSDDVVGVVPFGAENQRVANSEGIVSMDDKDDVAFPPPNQRNGDKGKPTCSRNESEENENKNNNPESSVLKAGDQPKSSSCYKGYVYMDDNEYDGLERVPDGFFEKGFPWNIDDCEGLFSYSEPQMNEPLMEHLVSGNYSLNDFTDLDSTDDVVKSFADEDAAS